MKEENKKFFEIMQSKAFVDVTNFWEIPYQKIFTEIIEVPDEYWRRPFNADNNDHIKKIELTDKDSVNYYPGSDNIVIEAKGWKSLCFLNETGDSKDQINRFPPIFETAYDYRNTLINFLNNRKWTNVTKFSPTLFKFFTEKVYTYMHVGQIFVTKLEPGGIISEHKDIPKDSYNFLNTDKVHMYDMLNTFNLTLNNLQSAYSVFDNKIIPSYEGCCILTNVGKSHWGINMNRKPLYKIIWQGIYKKEFRKLVLKKYESGDFI